MATIAQKFQSQMQNELAEVVQALAAQYNFDVADALRFINSTEPQPFTRKVSLKKSKKPKVSDEEKEAAKAAKLKAKAEAKAIKDAEKAKLKEAKKAEREAAKLAKKEAAKAAKLSRWPGARQPDGLRILDRALVCR